MFSITFSKKKNHLLSRVFQRIEKKHDSFNSVQNDTHTCTYTYVFNVRFSESALSAYAT